GRSALRHDRDAAGAHRVIRVGSRSEHGDARRAARPRARAPRSQHGEGRDRSTLVRALLLARTDPDAPRATRRRTRVPPPRPLRVHAGLSPRVRDPPSDTARAMRESRATASAGTRRADPGGPRVESEDRDQYAGGPRMRRALRGRDDAASGIVTD